MLVTLHGNAKKAQSSKEGYYFLQTDLVNEKPCWFHKGGLAIWADKDASATWRIGEKIDLGKNISGIKSKDEVEDPLQVLTWHYYKGDGWHESKDILVTKPGNI